VLIGAGLALLLLTLLKVFENMLPSERIRDDD
jgi:hypothetical protein